MLKDENIIVFCHTDWRIGPMSPQHISLNLAEENRVLFIETFGSRYPTLEREHIKRVTERFIKWLIGLKKQSFRQGELCIYSPIALMINQRPFLSIGRFIYLIILKRLIKRLHMENPILLFYIPPPVGVLEKLRKKAVIYYCVDEWLTFLGGKNKIFIDSEMKLMQNADLVLVSNKLLYETKKAYARRIYRMHHGVDYDHFSKEFAKEAPLPQDVKNIPRPIIAIIGAFTDWMDLDLIKLIAQRHKEWSIISIGLVESNVDISSLVDIGNIYFLGQKKYSDLPDYYRVIDAFIIPFLLTEHIKSCSPTRLYEHLSSGKPIIATDFAAVHEIGEGLIYIASSREGFVKRVETALSETDTSLVERRKKMAKENTWKSRAEEISGIIEPLINKEQ